MSKRKTTSQYRKGKASSVKCESFGHIQAECANTLKKNRSLNTMLSDDERKEETDYDEGDNVDHDDIMAFNVVVDMKVTSMYKV